MISQQFGGADLFFFERFLAITRIRHFVSGRRGGVSESPYDSLNLAFHVNDQPGNVLENRQRLARILNVPLQNFVFCNQAHSDNVVRITGDMRGSGASELRTAINGADAMITDVPNVMLTVLVADCVPVILYDPVKDVIGVVHAGWRGTVQFIVRNTVERMGQEFGCIPRDIFAGLGPSIGPETYRVREEVAQTVKTALPFSADVLRTIDGQVFFDLKESNRRQLINSGIDVKNIQVTTVCTQRSADIFFSERSRKPTGRFAAGIMKVV